MNFNELYNITRFKNNQAVLVGVDVTLKCFYALIFTSTDHLFTCVCGNCCA